MCRLLVVCALLGLVGCSKGGEDSPVECGPNGECPEGFVCDPIGRRCVTAGSGTPDAGGSGLALTVNISGGGTVLVSGAPSACTASSCSFNFTAGVTVTLTAQPAGGESFVGWSGSCSGSDPVVTVTMTQAQSCTATFGQRIVVSATVSGATGTVQASSSDAGASCSAGSCTIDPGGSVTLTAPSIDGSRFTGWSGAGCGGTSPVLQLTNVTSSITCTATYADGLAVLASVVGASGAVAATSTTPGAVCQPGGCTLGSGGNVTLTAPEIEDFRFTGWSGDPECTGMSLVLLLENVTHSISCSAGYVRRYTVSAAVTGATGASVRATSTDTTADCDGSSCEVDERGRVLLEAPELDGHRFTGWSGGCNGETNPLLVTNVQADRHCVAGYARRIVVAGVVVGGPTAPVVATSGDAGSVCASGSCTVDAPANVTLLAPSSDGHRFVGWSGTPACTGDANPLVLAGVTEAQSCQATFIARITVAGVVAGGPGTIVATSSDPLKDCNGAACTVDAPGTVTLTATAATQGYSFVGWMGPPACLGAGLSITLADQLASISCTATYSQRITVGVSVSGTTAEVRISSNAQTADCTVTECTVAVGDVVTIEVTGGDNRRFVGWDGAPCLGTGLGKKVDMVATVGGACAATFVDARSTTRPASTATWRNPTGWRDEKNQPIQMTLRPVAGAMFECRTGRTAVTGTSHVEAQPWGPCDGNLGLTPVVFPVAVPGDINGSYRTEARLSIVAYKSEPLIYDYYAHDSLNGALPCPEAATDLEIVSIANQLELPTNFAFPETDVVANPFIKLTLTAGFYNALAKIGTPFLPTPHTLDVLSLRHRFTILPRLSGQTNRYVAVRRQYESLRHRKYRNVSSCANSFEFGWKWVVLPLQGKVFGDPQQERLQCAALIMNARGQGHCLERNPLNGALRSAAYSDTLWEKLLQADSLSPKNRDGCTSESCGLYLPD